MFDNFIQVAWINLFYIFIQFQEKVDLGELMLTLCYLPTAGRLTLTVIKGRNLKAMDITGSSGINNTTDL